MSTAAFTHALTQRGEAAAMTSRPDVAADLVPGSTGATAHGGSEYESAGPRLVRERSGWSTTPRSRCRSVSSASPKPWSAAETPS